MQKFILLLWKGVYTYEYMDDWRKFSEISLPEKKDFYSHINMECRLLMQITNSQKGFVKILKQNN